MTFVVTGRACRVSQWSRWIHRLRVDCLGYVPVVLYKRTLQGRFAYRLSRLGRLYDALRLLSASGMVDGTRSLKLEGRMRLMGT